jgi:hypothetical protein
VVSIFSADDSDRASGLGFARSSEGANSLALGRKPEVFDATKNREKMKIEHVKDQLLRLPSFQSVVTFSSLMRPRPYTNILCFMRYMHALHACIACETAQR